MDISDTKGLVIVAVQRSNICEGKKTGTKEKPDGLTASGLVIH